MPAIDSLNAALAYSGNANLSATTTPLTTADLLAAPSSDAAPATAGSQILKVEKVDGHTLEESMRLFQKSWQLRCQVSDDARDVARTLKMSMKDVLDQRPDLADTAFDFTLENGRIKVVDTNLEGADLDWLTTTLNHNFLLVDKVKNFRRDAVEQVQTDAALGNNELNADGAQLGERLDDQVQFMKLFRQVGDGIQKMLMPTGSYRTQTGDAFDLSGPMNTAAGFVSFAEQMSAVEDGLNYITDAGKNTGIGLKMPNAYFAIGMELNKYLPDFDVQSIGFHAKA